MNKSKFLMSILLGFSLLLAACGPTSEDPEGLETPALPLETPMLQTPAVEGVGTPAVTPMETAAVQTTPTQAAQATTPAAEATASPQAQTTPQTQTTPIVPQTGGQMPPHLSEMLEFDIVDVNNQRVGAVQDYVINMCEAHLLYVVVDADQGETATGQGQMLIPYEAFTLSGEIRMDGQRQLVLNLSADEIADAPRLQQGALVMTQTDWEGEVMGFWEERAPMSFYSNCPVPPAGDEGTGDRVNITKIALATEVLNAEVEDGIGEVVGQVEDAIVVPESGLIRYMVITTLDQASSMTLVPMGALNVEHEASDGSQRTVLILLVEPEILEGSPRINTIPNSWDTVESSGHFDYWSQHVPMTREELP